MIDGPRLISEALTSGIEVTALFAEPEAAADVIARAEDAGVAVYPVRAGALAKVTSPITPQHVAARAVPPPVVPMSDLSGFLLILVDVADPGNMGTLFRSAEAAGVSGIVCCGQVVDVWSPKCVRASAGSVFRVPVASGPDVETVMRHLADRGVPTLATAAGGLRYTDADLTGDVAVLLGSEAHGLPRAAIDTADAVVSVPMDGHVESLNVAMVGTLVAFEAVRQRRGQVSQA